MENFLLVTFPTTNDGKKRDTQVLITFDEGGDILEIRYKNRNITEYLKRTGDVWKECEHELQKHISNSDFDDIFFDPFQNLGFSSDEAFWNWKLK